MPQAVNLALVEAAQIVSGKLAQKIEAQSSDFKVDVAKSISDITVPNVMQHPQALVNLPSFKEKNGRYDFDARDTAASVEALRNQAERLGVGLVIDVRPMPTAVANSATDAFIETVKPSTTNNHNIVKVIKLWVPTLYNKAIPAQRTVFAEFQRAMMPSLELETLAQKLIIMVNDEYAMSGFAAENMADNLIYRSGRRALELSFCAAVGTLGLLALVPAWIAVRAETPGAAIFRQNRVGQNGKVFKCLKLRSMYKGTKQTDSHAVGEAAITRVGAFIRKRKIDELPQFINILRGDMNLVGARPCIENLDDVIALRRQHGIFKTKPGLTGLAQVRHQDTSMRHRMVATELLYKHSRSLVLDFKIILATAFGKGFGDMAQRNGAATAAT